MPKTAETAPLDLTTRLLVSTPAMSDPRFAQSVIYLCAHGPDGAFGLVVNRAAQGVTLEEVLEQIGINRPGRRDSRPVMVGGPVEPQRGFVLFHPSDAADDQDADDDNSRLAPDEVQHLPDGLALSASTGVLQRVARGEAGRAWMLALGYAGWGPGQLEAEIADNAWLVADSADELIFASDSGPARWGRALRSMGVDPASLSGTAGHA